MTLGSLYLGAQGCVPLLLENLLGMSCPGTSWPLCGAWFHVGMEAFDELLSINVPWSREFPGVGSSLESGFGLKPPASSYRSYFYSSFKTSASIQHH